MRGVSRLYKGRSADGSTVVTTASAQTAMTIEGECRTTGRDIRSVIGRECFPPFIG